MRVPTSWLREYVDLPESPVEIAERLTMAGFEVEEILTETFGLEHSAAGVITAVAAHPDRPGFYVLTVSCGDYSVQVLSNLRKFDKGELLPVARAGFVFPDGTILEPRKMGGVMSDGKILSEADVEHSDNDGVILPLPAGAKPGDCVPDLLGISSAVLKFKLTANRGDCQNIYGIAREASAVFGRPIKKNPFDFELPVSPRDVEFSVDIKAPALCPRYSGRLLRNIKIEKSPVWMRRRLIAAGMRPINSIVDVTNYVMLEVGQPLHAFDLDTLENRAIIVRRARKGETIATIDGSVCRLGPDMLVIADARRSVAVAGVMGGADTEIKDGTRNMLLESAHFLPRSVRRTSLDLGMRTEASMRFEKGVDPTGPARCSDYAAFLIHKLGCGTPLDGMIDAIPRTHKPRVVNVSCRKVREFLGEPEIGDARMQDIMESLGFGVEAGKSSFKVTVPGHRFDFSIWQDAAEEIARIWGYNNVRSELPSIKVHRAVVTPNFAFIRKLKNMLATAGLCESVTYSFTNMKELNDAWLDDNYRLIEMLNPISEDHTHLRPTLVPGMLRVVSRNISRGNNNAALFELGKIFQGPAAEPNEKYSIAIAQYGRAWQAPTASSVKSNVAPYYEIKGVVESFLEQVTNEPLTFRKSSMSLFHPFRSASVFWGRDKIGEFGEVHPEVCANFDVRGGLTLAELDPDVIRAHTRETITFKQFSRFPASMRDLSLVVAEDVEAAAVRDALTAAGGDALNRLELVDVFRSGDVGEGKKSVTFALEFRRLEQTLSDDEVNAVVERMIANVGEKIGGALR